MKFTWIIIALIAGAFLPIQGGLNSRMGKAVENPIYASLISFLVGSVALVLYCLITRQQLSWPGLKAAPGYLWLGGVLGTFYVTVIVMAFPRLGPALTFGLVVAGQMIMSVLMDQFNMLVAQQQPINLMKLLGVVLIIGGVIIIRKF
ncbi:MAG TPA: DMT family transporter [Chitinophagaceae bacterium]|nr:DMT family transporter [Chitinophagaceae bacterium]